MNIQSTLPLFQVSITNLIKNYWWFSGSGELERVGHLVSDQLVNDIDGVACILKDLDDTVLSGIVKQEVEVQPRIPAEIDMDHIRNVEKCLGSNNN